MKSYKLAFLGFGNVGKALARLLLEKETEIQKRYGITFCVTGIATARHGTAINLAGIDLRQVLEVEDYDIFNQVEKPENTYGFIRTCGADILFENTPVNYVDGQPAIAHLQLALELGMHALTANKGPVVHAYRHLTDLASSMDRKFFFEAAVMDGAPIFSMFRNSLPAAQLMGFRGVLNSTTNLILTLMEQGQSFDRAVVHCQNIGIAETDPSGDIDGWDAAVKVAALVTVLMEKPLKPTQVFRTGIREITPSMIDLARSQGKRWKLVCSAELQSNHVLARVAPDLVGVESPMFAIEGTTSILQFDTDVLGRLSIVEENPGPGTTAYGLLADFLNSVQ